MQQTFETYLKVELRYSEHTLRAYLDDTNEFLQHHNIDFNELREITSKDVRRYVMQLMDAGLKPRSVNRKISSIKKMFFWALKNQLVELDPTIKVKSVKQEKNLPNFVRESEMISLQEFDGVFADDFSGYRDRLMVELLYQTGIRRSELIGLKESDWRTDGTIKVLGKRNKERIIPVSESLTNLKEEYLVLKNELFQVASDELLLTDRGRKLYPKFVYTKINYYIGTVSKLQKKSPHVLRHSFATHMLNNGAGIETIKELLGHDSIVATQIYAHNSFEKLKSIYKYAHPREGKPKKD